MLTEAPFSTAICVTTPDLPAKISFSIFIASSIATTVRGSTLSPTLTLMSIIVPGMGAVTDVPRPDAAGFLEAAGFAGPADTGALGVGAAGAGWAAAGVPIPPISSTSTS